jgi:hypothetical protein
MFPHFFYIFQVMIIDSFEFSDRICNSFFARTDFTPVFFMGSVLLIFLIGLSSYYVSWRSCCVSVAISAWIRCSVRLYLQLLVEGLMSYLCYLCLFVYNDVQHILCWFFCGFFCLRLVSIFDFPSSSCVHFWLPVFVLCPFLIVPSVFSNTYYLQCTII